MALIYRGNKVADNDVRVETAVASTGGTYRGAAIAFRQPANLTHNAIAPKRYRGVAY